MLKVSYAEVINPVTVPVSSIVGAVSLQANKYKGLEMHLDSLGLHLKVDKKFALIPAANLRIVIFTEDPHEPQSTRNTKPVGKSLGSIAA